MSIASLHFQHRFLTNPLTISAQNFRPRIPNSPTLSIKYPQKDHHQDQNESSGKLENQLGKLAIVTLASGVLTLGCVGDDALAAKSGARIGGQAFRTSTLHSSSPRVNSRTNISVNPPIAPPLVGGYGFGLGVPFYGGWSPFTFFVPSPSVAVGIGGGFDLLVLFMVFGAVAAVVKGIRGSRYEDDEYY